MATTCKLIAKQTLGSSAATVSFTDIPGIPYTDLLLVCSSRNDRSGVASSLYIQFNSSGGTAYSDRYLYGNGTSANSASDSSQAKGYVGEDAAATATSSTFSSHSVLIPNYAGNTNKSFSTDSVSENNATGAYVVVNAGLWANTNAITSMSLTLQSSANFVSGSSFFLYGITKA